MTYVRVFDQYHDDILYILRAADQGKVDHAYSRNANRLADLGLWELEHVGDEPERNPYYAQGGFLITSNPVFKSRLTDKGRGVLATLEEHLKPLDDGYESDRSKLVEKADRIRTGATPFPSDRYAGSRSPRKHCGLSYEAHVAHVDATPRPEDTIKLGFSVPGPADEDLPYDIEVSG